MSPTGMTKYNIPLSLFINARQTGNHKEVHNFSGGVHMTKKKRKNKELSRNDLLKIEIAREIGIWDQVEQSGWDSLSNALCGKVGGMMSKRLKEERKSPKAE